LQGLVGYEVLESFRFRTAGLKIHRQNSMPKANIANPSALEAGGCIGDESTSTGVAEAELANSPKTARQNSTARRNRTEGRHGREEAHIKRAFTGILLQR